MVLSPIVKTTTASIAVTSAAVSPSARLTQFAASSRRSEPKLQLDQSPRSPWRITCWPSSPVALKRFSTPHALVSPVQVAKHAFIEDCDNNQDEPVVEVTSPPSPTKSNGHEISFSSLWKRRPKSTESGIDLGSTEPAHQSSATEKKTTGGTIDLTDIRSSLATIRVTVKPVEPFLPRDSISQALAEEFGREVTLMRSSLYEELEEFRCSIEDRVKTFPEYLPLKEKELVQQVAESLRLACQIGETTVTVFKTGPFDGHSLPLRGRGRSVSEAFLQDDVFVDVPSLAQHGKDGFIARLRLRRLNSGGGIRRNMLWDVAELASGDGIADRVSEGEGGVYAVQSRSSGEKVAMFKPAEEEKFVREGIMPGEGAVREEAAYLLDSRSKGFSGVPATAVARLHVSNIGHAKPGAVQRFLMGSIGSMDGFGMPFDLAKAEAFVPTEQVHRIALLDIRTFNTDRHPGNILLIGDKAPYTMVPIDHGCILPSWFCLSEARFDWVEYPQSKMPLSAHSLAYVESINAEDDAVVLRKLGIREECVTTMKICALLLKLAASAGRTLHWMGSYMQRSGCFETPSSLEVAIKRACQLAGIPFSFVPNEYGEHKSQIPRGLLSRRPPSLFFKHLERLLAQDVHQDT